VASVLAALSKVESMKVEKVDDFSIEFQFMIPSERLPWDTSIRSYTCLTNKLLQLLNCPKKEEL
jgi:hypothetical protein